MQQLVELLDVVFSRLESSLGAEIAILLALGILAWWMGLLHRKITHLSRLVAATVDSQTLAEVSSNEAYVYLASAMAEVVAVRNTRIPGTDVEHVHPPGPAARHFRRAVRTYIRRAGSYREIVGEQFSCDATALAQLSKNAGTYICRIWNAPIAGFLNFILLEFKDKERAPVSIIGWAVTDTHSFEQPCFILRGHAAHALFSALFDAMWRQALGSRGDAQ